MASRHRAFIAPRLLGSLIGLAAFTIYVGLRGSLSWLEVFVFAWLTVPILVAGFLSRTGRYETAHGLSALALTALTIGVALATGGIGSFAAVWLVIVPIEAALSSSRRVVALASMLALGGAGFLLLMGHFGQLPAALPFEQGQAVLAALGIISAALYVTGLALGAQSLADGQAREVVAVMQDITKRKTQEAELRDARAEADRSNEAKSRFLATMSHELRTPLNAIIGFSDMLTNEGPMMIDAKRRQDYAHLINESGQHLLAVVNGILDMSKIESGKLEIVPEPFAPRQVIDECSAMLSYKAREMGVDLVVDLPATLPDLVADKRSLQQIMINLMSNAIKFTKRGGKVTVSAQVDAADVAMVVEDNGVGIDSEDLPRIGDPFFQARSSYDRHHDGTGLGLSIVKGLLGLHGGRMDIASTLGEGTRVTIRLPLDCEVARKRREIASVRSTNHIMHNESNNRVRISA